MNRVFNIHTPEELHPDLQPYVEDEPELGGFPMLRHPLVYSIPYHPNLNAALNEQYKYKREGLAAALQLKNYSQFVWLYERPYRLEAFFGVAYLMEDEQYWSLLGEIWTDSENIGATLSSWRVALRVPRSKTWYFMNEDDREALEKLPEIFTIYRGTQEGVPLGLSWTLDPDKAAWFANRFKPPQPLVLKGTVSKANVFAYLEGRGEQEIVVLPEHVAIEVQTGEEIDG